MPLLTLVYRFLMGAVYFRFRLAPGFRDPLNAQRLGRLDSGPRDLWIHAVSGGEVLLARSLLEFFPKDFRVLITTQSRTGHEAGLRLFGQPAVDGSNRVTVAQMPLDRLAAWRPLLDALRPRFFLVIEHDLWPELLGELGRRGVPRLLVNLAFKPRDLAWLRRFPWLIRFLYRVDGVTLQDAEAAGTWMGLSSIPGKSFGNLKYRALPLPGTVDPLFDAGDRRVVVFGSSHDPEEELILEAFPRDSGALLVLVPRHPDRAKEVIGLCVSAGFRSALWSSLSGPRISKDLDVVVVDRMGLLLRAYAGAHLALVGDTLRPSQGGHNVLEPLALGVPVAYGEFLRLYRDVTPELERSGASQRVPAGGWKDALRALLGPEGDLAERGRKGREAISRLRFDDEAFRRHVETLLR